MDLLEMVKMAFEKAWPQAIVFLAAWFIITRFILSPSLQLFQNRKKYVSDLEDGAQQGRDKLESALKDYEERVGSAKTKALEEKMKIIQEGKEEEEKILGEAEKISRTIVEETAQKIREERDRAKAFLQQEVQVWSKMLVEKGLGRPVQ